MSNIDKLENFLFVEKYRPHCVEDCILPTRIKTILKQMVDAKNIKSYTAIGHAGSGKTSSAKALLEELDVDYIMINASKNGNIETIRTTINEFATKMTLNPLGFKVVLLDEADGLSQNAANSLRGVIEEFQETCRFILTANYANKVPPALKSRCPVIDFNFNKDEKKEMLRVFFNRVEQILKENTVHYDRKELLVFCDKNFPDFRNTLNIIDRSIINNSLELKNVGSVNDDKIDELIGYLRNTEFTKMRKWVAESGDTEPSLVRRALYNRAYDVCNKEDIPAFILLLNEYDYKEAFVTDKEVNFVCLLTELMKEVRFE